MKTILGLTRPVWPAKPTDRRIASDKIAEPGPSLLHLDDFAYHCLHQRDRNLMEFPGHQCALLAGSPSASEFTSQKLATNRMAVMFSNWAP